MIYQTQPIIKSKKYEWLLADGEVDKHQDFMHIMTERSKLAGNYLCWGNKVFSISGSRHAHIWLVIGNMVHQSASQPVC